MSNLTNYSENWMLKVQLTTEVVTRPTAWWVGVGTGRNDDGITGEPSGNGYARQSATFSVTADTSTNTALLVFGPCATASWGSISTVGIFDAATGGNCLWAGNLAAARTVDVGDSLTIAASAFSQTMS